MAPAIDDADSTGAAATTAAVASPLNAAANVGATLKKDVHTVEWNGQVSANSFHIFVNETGEELELSWGDDLRDNPHSNVAPHANAHVGTYDFHTWRVRSKGRGLIATYTGSSVILTVTEDGHKTQLNPTGQRPHPQPAGAGTRQAGRVLVAGAAAAAAGGTAAASAANGSSAGGGAAEMSEPGYRQRSSVLGMPIWAFDGVSDAAVARLAKVVGCMLAHSPAALLERLVAGGASFAVFGTEQVVTDVPAHRFMRYNTGRDLDTSARGLGATPTVPVTSCGEENLTMEGDRWYPCQSILIHEVGHMVHNMGLPPGSDGVEGVLEAYRAAMKAKLYPKGCYMATNEQEYWAVAVESWFESTIREDVNGGVKTRAALKKHDSRLAALLESAFGDGEWRYWKDCPRALTMPSRAPAAPASAASRPAAAAGSGGAAVAPVPPSWRSRRPAKLLVDSLLDNSDSTGAVRLLLRRMLCRRFIAIRRRRGKRPPAPDGEPAATAAAAAAAGGRGGVAAPVAAAAEYAESGAGGSSAVYKPPPLPVPIETEVPPPLPSAGRSPGGRGGAGGRGGSRRKEAEELEVEEPEEWEEVEEAGEGSAGEVPVPLPAHGPLPIPVLPLAPGPAPPPPPPPSATAAAAPFSAAGGDTSR